MFEKEAKEYEDSYIKSDYCERVRDTWRNGAVFGYTKASEWHDLRKKPDDLPEEGEIVLCYCLGVCGVSYPITAQMYFDYHGSDHYWYPSAASGNRPLEELRNVLAWKEIAIPMGIVHEKEETSEI